MTHEILMHLNLILYLLKIHLEHSRSIDLFVVWLSETIKTHLLKGLKSVYLNRLGTDTFFKICDGVYFLIKCRLFFFALYYKNLASIEYD